jgi:tetratricopeptide (TPR) repeat protein
MSDLLKNPKICGACDKPGCKQWCACKLVYYCGAECQGKHWPTHKEGCTIWLAKKISKARMEHGNDSLEVSEALFEGAEELRSQGRYRDAEKRYLNALRIAAELLGEESFLVGQGSRGLGRLYVEMGRYDEAMEKFLGSYQIMRIEKGERSIEAADVLCDFGTTLRSQGKSEEALSRLEEAQSILEEAVGPEHPYLCRAIGGKAMCFDEMGRLQEARAAYEEVHRINLRVDGDVADSHKNLGNIFLHLGMLDEAKADFEQLLKIMRRVHGERHPHVANAFNGIAHVLRHQGNHDEAIEVYKKALKIRRRVLGEDHKKVAESLDNIGFVYFDQAKYGEALEMFREALEVFRRALGIDHEQNALVLYNISKAQFSSDDPFGGLQSIREANRIYTLLGINNEQSRNAAALLSNLSHG